MSWKTHGSSATSNSDAGEVLRIYQMLTPKPDDLIRQGRKFIKEGDVQVWSVKERMKKHRHLFLFNDVLLITKKEGSKKFWLKVYISLRSGLKIQDVTDSTNDRPDVEFRIYAPKKTFILFGFNPSHKFEWINAIQAQIDQNEGKAESVKKEKIDELYQAPPSQPLVGDFDRDFDHDFDPRGSIAPAPHHQQPQGGFDTFGGPPAHQQQFHHQSGAFSGLPEPAYEDQSPVPVLPPPPGMKRDPFAAPGNDPFAAPGNDPFAALPPHPVPAPNPHASVINPYAPPLQQPFPPNPHASVINPYAPPPVNPYAPPPVNPYAPPPVNPYTGGPPLQPNPYATGFQPQPLQPNPYAPGGPGAIPSLPPKPLPTPGGMPNHLL